MLRNWRPHPGILIDKIPAKGIGGLIFALGTVAIFTIGVPAIREVAPYLLGGGLFVAGLLYLWHWQTRW